MDEIQRILVEAGRKDLAQKYYKKISKLEKSDRWEEDSATKNKKLNSILKENGLSDITDNFPSPDFIAWFVDSSKELEEFWNMNHAWWRDDTRIGRKGHDIYLVDWIGNVLKFELKIKKL